MLSINTYLHALTLGFNNIGNEGAGEIAKNVRTNTTLHTLSLIWNNIGKEGTVEIAELLSIDTTLHKLNLAHNFMGKEGALEIAKILDSKYTLTDVYLEFPNTELTKIIDRNKNLFDNQRFTKTKVANI